VVWDQLLKISTWLLAALFFALMITVVSVATVAVLLFMPADFFHQLADKFLPTGSEILPDITMGSFVIGFIVGNLLMLEQSHAIR